ncbi:MAG: SDR family oxidoreductase [Planctomycetota bacterium]
MSDTDRLDGKVCLVTGGGTGIGRATAVLASGLGAKVVLAGRTERTLRETADSCVEEVALCVGDVSIEADVQRIVKTCSATFGGLDMAFNNAGIEGRFGPLAELSASDFDTVMRVNTRGVWLCTKHEAAAMEAGGSIVQCSSWLAQGALPGSTIYSASKAALDGMTRAAALELAGANIRVNNVNPGIIDTPMYRRFAEPGSPQSAPFEQQAATRRLGTPDEVAQAVCWLLGGASSFVTGQTMLVDGGFAVPGHRPWN